MKIKKIITFILVCMLILSSMPVSAEEMIISSIADGAILTESPAGVTLFVDSGCDVLLLLDGDVIAEFVAQGNDTVKIEKELEVGKHKMVAVLKDGEDILTQEITFERTYTGIDTGSAIYVNQDKLLGIDADKVSKDAGHDKDGNPATISKALFDGKDGENGGAVGFKTSAALGDIDGAKHIHLPLYWSSAKLEGIVEIEYDVRIDGKMRFEFETSGSAGYGNFGLDNMINNGKIAGTVDYVSGQWYHIKHIVNLDSGRQDLYVDGEVIKSNFKMNNPEGINTVKVQARGDVADTVSAVMIDNFSLGYPYTVKAGENISYLKDGEYIPVEDEVLTEEAVSFRVRAEGAKSTDATVKVFEDGEETETVVAKVDGEGNVDFTLKNALSEEADVKFLVESDKWTMANTLKNRVSDFGVTDVSYKTGSVNVYTSKQLERDNTLTAFFNVYNNGESREAVVIATVYEGNKMVSISSKTQSFGAGETKTEISLDIPDKDGEYTAECYLFDSLPSRKPLSKIWYLN